MNKVLFDTNVVLDALLSRPGFWEPAARLLSKLDRGELDGFLCATTVTTIHCIGRKQVGTRRTEREIERLLKLFEVAPVDGSVLQRALRAGFADYEDAVVSQAAQRVGAEAIVTRNAKDFRKSPLRIYSPDELLALLKAS